MIVGDYFEGDNNERLKLVQHDMYWTHVAELFFLARERYLRAVRLIGLQTELSRRLQDKTSFDHRILQMAHDLVAAHYRLISGDHSQMPLPFHGEMDYDAWLRRKWSEFYHEEVKRLIEVDTITLAILQATVMRIQKLVSRRRLAF